MKLGLLTLVAAAAGVSVAGASLAAPHSLKVGERVVFKAGTLKPGIPVACVSHNKRVVVRVPSRGQSMVRISDWAGGGSTTLRLTTRANGSVVAVCQ